MLPVLIVDDHRLVAEAIAGALRADGFVDVDCADPEELDVEEIVARAGLTSPTVVLVSLRIAGGHTALALVRDLVAVEAIVIIVSPIDDDALLGECLVRGAEAVLRRSMPLADATEALRAAMRGERIMSEQDRSAFMQAAVSARHAARADTFMWKSLTAREQEVLGHLAHGRRVNEIARLNDTSESTVRTQVKRVLAKLEVGSQTAAVVLALRAGWFEDI